MLSEERPEMIQMDARTPEMNKLRPPEINADKDTRVAASELRGDQEIGMIKLQNEHDAEHSSEAKTDVAEEQSFVQKNCARWSLFDAVTDEKTILGGFLSWVAVRY